MRKSCTTILFSLLLLAGIATTLSAIDKKDDKNGEKKGHPPVIIIVWEPAWPPIMRESSTQSIVSTFEIESENSLGSL